MPDRVLALTVSVPWLRMPPPRSLTWVPEWATPLLIVRPLRVTELVPVATSNTREWPPPLIVSSPAPGPAMVKSWLMSSSPLVSVMVWPFRLGAKTMVSPLWAAAMSARKEPAPLSRRLLTVSVLGTQRASSVSSVGRKMGRLRGYPCRFRFRSQEGNHMMHLLSGAGLR